MIAGLATLCACLVARFSHAIQFNYFSESGTSFYTVSDLFICFCVSFDVLFLPKFLLCFDV